MNRARPSAAAVSTATGLTLVAARGENPYATSGAVRPVVPGARQLSASTVPASTSLGPVLTDVEDRPALATVSLGGY